jgi:hypothetical protein
MNIPETLKMPSLSGYGKRPQGILRNQIICGFFGFKFSFQNCFWNVFSTSGLSQICKIRNVWKPLLMEYSDPMLMSLWKDFLEFKNIILEENIIIKLTVMTILQAKGFPWFWDFFLRYAKTMKFRDYSLEILRGRIFLWPFLNLFDNFSSKMMF